MIKNVVFTEDDAWSRLGYSDCEIKYIKAIKRFKPDSIYHLAKCMNKKFPGVILACQKLEKKGVLRSEKNINDKTGQSRRKYIVIDDVKIEIMTWKNEVHIED